MSTTIYYFSATGNSLFVAQKIAKQLKDTILISIKSLLNEKLVNCNSQNIGLIFPVYFFGLPTMISDFIRKLKIKNNQYLFGIAVHGGVSGNALYQFQRECECVGIKPAYLKDIEVCGSYIVLYKPPLPESFVDTHELNNYLNIIFQDILEHKTCCQDTMFHPVLRLIYKLNYKRWKKSDRNFIVEKQCNGCETCKKICSANNISIIKNVPVFKHNCQHCMACVHWCPKNAIQYKSATIGKNRYRNPYITFSELSMNEPKIYLRGESEDA